MEEKKLTEEKAFTLSGITEWLSTKAKTDEDMYYAGAIAGTYLAYERLQGENAEIKKWYDTQSKLYNNLQEEIQAKKAEIERLKGFLQTFKTVIKEKDEQIEQRLEEVYADFMKEYKIAKQDLKESLEREVELQKQVDKLTSEKEDLYFQNKNLQTYIDNHEAIWKRNAEQAVKDTVKAVADWLDNEKGYCGLGYLVKKHFGVEVE